MTDEKDAAATAGAEGESEHHASEHGESARRESQPGDAGPDHPPSHGPAPAPAHDRDRPPSPCEPPPMTPRVEPPSADVDTSADSATLPGAHRGGFTRPPTAPVPTPSPPAPADDGDYDELDGPYAIDVRWAPASEPEPRPIAGWALGLAVVALLASFFVGWGFPVGIVALIVTIMSLRRPRESRVIAGWALALTVLSLLYSAGWLLWSTGVLPPLW